MLIRHAPRPAVFVVGALSLLSVQAPVQATGGGREPAPPPVSEPISLGESPTGRYLVEFAPTARERVVLDGIQAAHRPAVVERLSGLGTWAVVESDLAGATELAGRPGVLAVHADVMAQLDGTQSSPPWGLDRIDEATLPMDSLYEYPNSGAGVTAYVLDSGTYDHADFGGRVQPGVSMIDAGNGRSDCHGHGTHVAGTIASSTYGVAKAATVVPIKVAYCDGSLSMSTAISGVNWAISHHSSGPAVLNASLGGSYFAPWDIAVNAAVADGITVVVAAGNFYGANACLYSPASASAAITVGSSDSDDWVSDFSNVGTCLDLFAPGGSILSLNNGAGSAVMSGTSMASPHVAGVAALILGQHPSMPPAQVASNINGSATSTVLSGVPTNTYNRLLRVPTSMAAPANDSMNAAAPLNIWVPQTTGGTLFSTKEGGEPTHAGFAGGGSIWYRYQSAVAGSLTLTTEFSSFDTLLAVYSGGPGAFSSVAANDQAYGTYDWSRVVVAVSAGTDYWVAVDGYQEQRGTVQLNPSFVPTAGVPNDAFAASTSISPTRAGIADAHTRGATHEVSEPAHAGRPGVGSAWWSFTAPANGRLVVSTQGSAFDTTLGTYTGTAVGGLTPVASDDDTEGLRSQVEPIVTNGTTYRVAVDGYSNGTITGTGGVQLHSAFVSSGTGWYSPLAAPVRLMDTRLGQIGALEPVDVTTPFSGGEVRRYTVSSVAGLAGATSVALNVATLNQAATGYLSIFPCTSTGDTPPTTAAINYGAGMVVANSALVGLAAGGFCVLSSQTADVLIDAFGAFVGTANYAPLATPARLVDTRPAQPGLATPVDETAPFSAGEIRRYVVPAAGGIPSVGSISSLAVNLAAVGPAAGGYLKAWPCTSTATPSPATSVLNFRSGLNTANAGVLSIASDGGFCVQASQATHVIVDVPGTYALYGSTVANARPQRVLDTRGGQVGTSEVLAGADTITPLAAGVVTTLTLPMRGGVPGNGVANSAILNVTVVGNTATGYLTIWPCASAAASPPAVSTLNFRPGGATSNGAVVGLTSTTVCVVASQAAHLIVDVTGWQAAPF